MSVVYAGICKPTGKIYVGKHNHGRSGKSVQVARCKPSGYKNCTVMHRAILKHGFGSFDWWIVERVPQADVKSREAFWISARGFDTVAPNGLNILTEDTSTPISDEARLRMSVSQKVVGQRPEVKQIRSKFMTKRMSDPDVRLQQSNTMRQIYKGPSGALLRSKLSKSIAKGMNESAVKAKLSESMARRKADTKGWSDLMNRAAEGRRTDSARKHAAVAAQRRMQSAEGQAHKNRLADARKMGWERRRKERLDACSTEDERQSLLQKFAKYDASSEALAKARRERRQKAKQ